MKYLILASEVATLIASIKTRGQELDHDIHVAGVSCLAQIRDHSNTTLLNNLVNALPKGARKTAFVEWALKFGSVRLLVKGDEADADAIAKGQTFKLKRDKDTDLDGAIANAWYNFKPEPDVLDVFDLNKAFNRLQKQYSKAVKQGASIEGVDEARKQLREMLRSLDVLGTALDTAEGEAE